MYQTPIHQPISRNTSPAPGIMNPQAGYSYPAPIARPISRAASPIPPGGVASNRSSIPPDPQAYGGYGAPVHGYAAPIAQRPLSRGPSPAPPGVIAGHRSPMTDFQVEKRARSPNPYGRPPMGQPEPTVYRDELVYRDHVSALIAAKDTQFGVNGRIPVDPAQLVLFFRSKTGITHSLDFPVDVAYNTPPALDVLIAACRPHPTSDYDSYGAREGLFYPTNLPLTASLEIANYPILDAIRSSLFPNLPPGQYLTALIDRLDVVESGSHLTRHSPAQLRNDDRAATIVVTLPVRFRGGAIVVRDSQGREERFIGGGGKNADIDWVALRADCTYEVEPVQKGIQLSISYGVFIRAFGPASPSADTLVTPTDRFFDLLSPILNMSRGRTIGFYLNHDYTVNPAEVVANTVVTQLKGADALLYDAFKFHKLAPELHWTAGGYVWPQDHTLEFFGDDIAHRPPNPRGSPNINRSPFGGPRGGANIPPVRGAFGAYGGNPTSPYHNEEETDTLRARVEGSGAVSLEAANITLLTDFNNPAPTVGRERVYFVSNGELEKLVVNILLVVYIP
ncbi:hypothetical protein NLJ89_g2387 [Agrocybe chaxingu]|uniref:Uncharacterized protein n=1 Tax=Agrocybe chaxingu TaxID=84603 RepID=A0A9W8MWI2_9AGAR|nr:hypothetical protein NLJ89_g2387 [Agrocybe chaxingu]